MQQAFRAALGSVGEGIFFTSRAAPTSPVELTATIAALGPEDEGYKERVGTRFAVEFLEVDLDLLIPAKHDRIDRVAPEESFKVVEVSSEWGFYRLVCEKDGRPVPR